MPSTPPRLGLMAARVRAWAGLPSTRTHLAPALVTAVGALSAAGLTLFIARDMWFMGDDWDFVLTRGTVPEADRGWLDPHYDHWLTMVVLINRGLFALFGLHSYLPYMAVPLALHVVIVMTLYALLVRAGSNRWVAAAVCWMIAFLGAGSQALMWAASMNLLGSMACGLLALLAWDRISSPWRRLSVVSVLLVVGLMFSGVGPVMVLTVGMYALFVSGWRKALAVLPLPLGIYLLWFLTAGPASEVLLTRDRWTILKVPAFVWNSLFDSFGQALGMTGAGILAAGAVVAGCVVLRDVPDRLRLLAWTGLLTALGQLLLIGLTRYIGEPGTPLQGRYVYLTMVLCAPAVALLLDWVLRQLHHPRTVAGWVALVLLAGYVLNGVGLMQTFARDHEPYSRPWASWMVTLNTLVDEGQKVINQPMDLALNPSIEARLVTSKQIRQALPDAPVTPQSRLMVQSLAMVAVGSRDFGQSSAPTKFGLTLDFDRPIEPKPGCHTYQGKLHGNPTFELHSLNGTEVVVYSGASMVTTQLFSGELEMPAKNWSVEPDTYVHIATSAPGTMLRVNFNKGGRFVICAV